MYTGYDFRTKEALIEAVKSGRKVTVFQPRKVYFFSRVKVPVNGTVKLIGPHFNPIGKEPTLLHSWIAEAELKDGVITRVI